MLVEVIIARSYGPFCYWSDSREYVSWSELESDGSNKRGCTEMAVPRDTVVMSDWQPGRCQSKGDDSLEEMVETTKWVVVFFF